MKGLIKLLSLNQRFLFFVHVFVMYGTSAFTQSLRNDTDTLVTKEWKFESAAQLADTAWWALQQKTNEDLLSLMPSYEIIKLTLDSLQIKNNPQIVKIKYNTILVKLNKQVRVLSAKARANKIKFKTCEKTGVKIDEGQDDKGHAFAYVSIKAIKNKREFYIKFVALSLNHHWYLVDELKLEFPEEDPYFKKPIKNPIKLKSK